MRKLVSKVWHRLLRMKMVRIILDIPVFLFTRVPIIKHLYFGLLKYIADTGKGTDLFIKNKIMLFPIHYYYPIPDFKTLKERGTLHQENSLHGLNFNESEHLEFLNLITRKYGEECNFRSDKSDDVLEFSTANSSFSFGCASALHCIIREFKPNRIIEVGIGNSSKVISNAISMNKISGQDVKYTAIDPYPPNYVKDLPHISDVIETPVETLDLDLFKALEGNDILFIDSSHQVKVGNDVMFLYLDVLPILKPGVLVHIHDIGLPDHYPEAYYFNESFRVCWNEQYFLQAFLSMNHGYRIKLPMSHIMKNHIEPFKNSFPHYNPENHIANSGSFWIQRCNN